MTEDTADLIEHIQTTTDQALRKVVAVFQIEDPVERFKAFTTWDDPATEWIIPRAKAVTIHEMRTLGGERRSNAYIGRLLGVSAQRVQQLANPEPRRPNERRRNHADTV